MIPLTSPLASYESARSDIDAVIARVLSSGTYILGPEVKALEVEFAQFIGVEHAVAVANGTDAVALALRALGVGPGDEVITVSHTAVATVSAIEQMGATPVLADVEPGYHTLDFDQVRKLSNDATAAVVVVHLYGQAADMGNALAYRASTGVPIIEDCAQAHGARWNGMRLGSIGDVGAFSCYPTKNLGAIGDAGLITTRSTQIADRLRGLRQYGWKDRNVSLEAGVNSRMDELQAGILRVQLARLDIQNGFRAAIAERYAEQLAGFPIRTPLTRAESSHVFHLFVCEVAERESFREHLRAQGVDTAIHYPIPVHLQPAYAGRIRHGRMKVTDGLMGTIVSLPMYPELSFTNVDCVIEAIKSYYA